MRGDVLARPGEHNVEMDWADVRHEDYLTPNDRFFIRSQGPVPSIDPGEWRLRIGGPGAQRSLELTYRELEAMSTQTMTRALECAGNGRVFFSRVQEQDPPGRPWGLGAIGVAEWTGVPLRELLERAGVDPATREVVPEGLDGLRVRRPLPLSKAMAEDTLVAVAMNGEPLSVDHGFPARLVVPGWAAVASIKWLGRIHLSDVPVQSRWNTELYVLRGPGYDRPGPAGGVVITEQVMKSALELPWPARLEPGPAMITGRAWSPSDVIERVDVRVDGDPWRTTELVGPNLPGAWVRFRFRWDARQGAHEVRVRATDRRGLTQPDRVPWNERGYLFGGVIPHPVRVERSAPEG